MDMFKDKTGEVYKWVVDNCLNGDTEDTDNDLTLGIKCGNKLVAGVVYSNVGKITYLTIYAENPRWCTKANLTRLFEVPFKVFDSKIVKCCTSHKNKRINKLLWGLKLREEGHLRYTRRDSSHLKVFSMTYNELKQKRWYTHE